jgi:hypothetical protein
MTDIAQLKAEMIAAWDSAHPEPDDDPAGAAFEALRVPRRPRRGLAVGHSIDPGTKAPRLEMRITASGGPDHARAKRLADEARTQGFEVILKVIGIPQAPVVAAAVVAAKIGGRRRPLHLGCSVAHYRGSAGTLGAFVKDPDGADSIVSCAHVLAWAGKCKVKIDNDVHQPGPADQDTIVEGNHVGRLTNFTPFVEDQKANLDAAVARLAYGAEANHDGNVFPDLPGVPKHISGKRTGDWLALDEPHLGCKVFKIGRTTGYTTAEINALDFENLSVSIGGVRTFTFGGVYEVIWKTAEPFAGPGDSGALVCTVDGRRPVGLHFASVAGVDGQSTSYIVPWQRIRDNLGVELI